ncbi:hypothetical protein C1S99_24220 [Vibrio parahaemolyticus]|uniref:hypothetical protein n=2 Tax=Vibrio parahaemolyticus TaxID=670 RepID=UPI000542A314|nr:hypothetical protein [Vibrio parahaemolyticus]EGQ8919510.1 hypothetical protein [Vibrio parahaemolyticus]EJB8687439.1 hypothetical protein [Vibrio parahaemolyticus]EJH2588896.1 hypothetical protein [Vibrio parahaemolyticus]ELA9409212.1 hypothetical protein [Vibrio parahaemolyticus]ELA9436499.1 hypothetical protein [Vibrio parahaemolyticus]
MNPEIFAIVAVIELLVIFHFVGRYKDSQQQKKIALLKVSDLQKKLELTESLYQQAESSVEEMLVSMSEGVEDLKASERLLSATEAEVSLNRATIDSLTRSVDTANRIIEKQKINHDALESRHEELLEMISDLSETKANLELELNECKYDILMYRAENNLLKNKTESA